MRKNSISILTGIILTILSLQSLALSKSCPSINYFRREVNTWIYAKKWSDGRWIFLSNIFYHDSDIWNLMLVLKLPNINDPRIASEEASKQIKTLQLVDPYLGNYDSCSYTPKGVSYSVETYSPPMGP